MHDLLNVSLISKLRQMVYSALALAQSEVTWYFQHVGIASSKSKAARIIPVDIVKCFHPVKLLYQNVEEVFDFN